MTAGQPTLAGRWAGGFEVKGGWRFMRLDAERRPDGLVVGSADVLFEGEAQINDVTHADDHVAFTLAREVDGLRFEGVLEGDVIQGFVSSATRRGQAVLLRTQALRDSGPYRGTYELTDGRMVAVSALEGFYVPGSLEMVEIPSGEVRFLFPTTDGSLVAGPGLLVPVPVERRLAFAQLTDGKLQQLRMREVDGGEIDGQRLKLREEEIRFRSGALTLVGTLVLPPGDGPHPAVIIAHGSGDAVRDDPFAHVVARLGLAFFRYDKRGVGDSGGDWHTASFDDLAGDVVAALQHLGQRADIDSSRIGIWGWSQGGWIAPLAAARAADVAFLLLQVPPAVSPAQQEIHRVENELRADGFAQSTIYEALEFMRRKAAYARTGQGWPAFERLLARAGEAAWFPYAGSPMHKDSWGWDFFRLINDHDPIPVLEQIRCPVLALFGELDRNVLPAVNAPILEAALHRAGNRDVSVKVFRRANHGLFECREGGPKELPLVRRYVPTYVSTVLEWLKRWTRSD